MKKYCCILILLIQSSAQSSQKETSAASSPVSNPLSPKSSPISSPRQSPNSSPKSSFKQRSLTPEVMEEGSNHPSWLPKKIGDSIYDPILLADHESHYSLNVACTTTNLPFIFIVTTEKTSVQRPVVLIYSKTISRRIFTAYEFKTLLKALTWIRAKIKPYDPVKEQSSGCCCTAS